MVHVDVQILSTDWKRQIKKMPLQARASETEKKRDVRLKVF